MTTLTSTEARKTFGRMLKAAEQAPVLVTRRKRPVAAFIPLSDFEGVVSEEAIRQAIAARLAEALPPIL